MYVFSLRFLIFFLSFLLVFPNPSTKRIWSAVGRTEATSDWEASSETASDPDEPAFDGGAENDERHSEV